MKPAKHMAIMLGLGEPGKDDEEGDDYEVTEQAKSAAQDFIDAIKGGDAESVAMAFQKLDEACSSGDEEKKEMQ